MIDDFNKILSERRKRECSGKVAYSTSQKASAARKRMETRHKDQQFTEYTCDFCGAFHIGHTRYQHRLKDKEDKIA